MKWHYALLMLGLPLVAQAKITSATLYPSHAQLVWQQPVSVEQGSGEISLEGLPVSLQDDTLMAEIRGLPGVLTQRVQIRQVEQTEVAAKATRELQEALQQLEYRIGAREDEIQSWNQQVRLMAEAAGTPKEITASELAQLGATVQERTQQALTRIRDIRNAMADDLAERDRIERELAATQQNAKATKTVTIAYQAETAGQGSVRLQYQTHEAGWRSQYNARLQAADSGTEGTLVLEHLALIRQTTGLDWDGVQVSLSTANTRSGTDIPPLQPWLVAPGGQPEYRSQKALSSSMDMVQSEVASSPQPATIEDQGAFTQSYRIQAPVSLASGNSDQFVTIANHNVPVSIETRFYPAMDLNGFIHATGLFEAEASLPGGPATLYRDGQSVGRTYLESLSTGSELAMGFGVNDRVIAEVINEQNQTGEQGVFKGEKYVRQINRYEITNNHPRAVAVRVFDRIPVSRQDQLTVEELDISEPVQRDALDIKGVLSWERQLQPGEAINLTSGFELRVPDDAELPPEFR
ncbi:DUF4139 domain-containing protein [Marinobacter confluentis]|uniref:Mucoidy inhibitor MuiA family protein n=1 Tax=Marinobacter confluentis TaxID=1697557 RepID=A0A4Z1CC16_9GAMM|nr:DUF4139 domain-containing protein [Marinobacter confluentis]TGN41706.1 mucoidy inhibitor MuiA family protein [Marinobacter confluentis]